MPGTFTWAALAAVTVAAFAPGLAVGQEDAPPQLNVYADVSPDRTVTLTANGYIAHEWGDLVVSIDQRNDEECPATDAALPDEGYWVLGSDTDSLSVGPDEWEETTTFRPGPAAVGWWRVCAYLTVTSPDAASTDTLTASTSYLVPSQPPAPGPVLIACWDGTRRGDGTEVYRATRKPRACTHFGPGGTFGGGVNLARIRWSGWGRPTARAVGIELGFHLPLARIPVQIRATGIRRGCDGRRYYSRLSATSKYGTARVALTTCPG